jgi:hypothetical protein
LLSGTAWMLYQSHNSINFFATSLAEKPLQVEPTNIAKLNTALQFATLGGKHTVASSLEYVSWHFFNSIGTQSLTFLTFLTSISENGNVAVGIISPVSGLSPIVLDSLWYDLC